MSNPVGVVQFLPEVEALVSSLTSEWQKTLIKTKRPKWWQFWRRGTSMHDAAMFVINSVDKLVDCVEGLIEVGPDKKATVMHAVGLLFDYVVRECMPIYLKPFAGKLKHLIVNVIVGNVIDWMVAKYREGAWKEEPVEPPVAEPVVEPVEPVKEEDEHKEVEPEGGLGAGGSSGS